MLPETAIGAVVAAMITGTISLVGLIISKENKISEFRQIWIDELRNDISLVISKAYSIEIYCSFVSDGENEKIWENTKEHFAIINAAISRIKMRVNPQETEASNLLLGLEKMEKYINSHGTGENIEFSIDAIENEIIIVSRIALKKEWSRVTKGERIYNFAKYSSLIISLMGLVFLLWA